MGHARHAQDEVSRPVLRTREKTAGIQDNNDKRRNNKVTALNVKRGDKVQ